MIVILALSVLALGVFSYFLWEIWGPLSDMIRNRLLYRSYLTRAEQAMVEKNLSRLSRVVVMCDRVDPPEHGFLQAVKDNFYSGVKYVFLVSNRASQEDVDRYREMFSHIESAVRYEAKARSVHSSISELSPEPLFEVHRLKQGWDDYPYICYEFFTDGSDQGPQYLMYRGNEIGVGIASEYVRIAPETAYSLIKRADALKAFIAAEPDKFVDGRAGSLGNEPMGNVVSFASKTGNNL